MQPFAFLLIIFWSPISKTPGNETKSEIWLVDTCSISPAEERDQKIPSSFSVPQDGSRYLPAQSRHLLNSFSNIKDSGI